MGQSFHCIDGVVVAGGDELVVVTLYAENLYDTDHTNYDYDFSPLLPTKTRLSSELQSSDRTLNQYGLLEVPLNPFLARAQIYKANLGYKLTHGK